MRNRLGEGRRSCIFAQLSAPCASGDWLAPRRCSSQSRSEVGPRATFYTYAIARTYVARSERLAISIES
ncbi:unnamed protein product [Trichogramma brassicae]|uniref:Uncharacterized protein n=1 Tax=Trichogramma brassicae TaxID=86971 RepID=A0A6H5IAV4_9HYME|nr:unnamed protein product [Trichogramma brassicae]